MAKMQAMFIWVYNRGGDNMMKILDEIKKQTLTLVVAALGFVTALMWRDAIAAWLRPLYEGAEGEIGLTIAALVVTIGAVIITIILTKILGSGEAGAAK